MSGAAVLLSGIESIPIPNHCFDIFMFFGIWLQFFPYLEDRVFYRVQMIVGRFAPNLLVDFLLCKGSLRECIQQIKHPKFIDRQVYFLSAQHGTMSFYIHI